MKYDPRMIEAHEQSLAAYDRLIEILKDSYTSLEDKQEKVSHFYDPGCKYCLAGEAIEETDERFNACGVCILNTTINGDCNSEDDAEDTYNAAYGAYEYSEDLSAKEMTIIFQERRDWLATRAKQNLARKE